MATITLRSIKGSPLTIEEVDQNFTNLNTDVGTRLLASEYTAADILTKLKTIDGAGSELDADTLDGLSPNYTNAGSTIVSRDSGGSFAAQTITANLFSGNVTGNLTGNVTGNLTGNTTGLHIGNVTGNLTGVTYGVHHGGVNDEGQGIIGTLTGNVTGNLTGNTTGLHTGNMIGDVTGNVSGNAGTVTNGVYTNTTYDNPSWLVGLAGSKVTSIPNTSLQNSSVTINGNTVALGGSTNITVGYGAGMTNYDVTNERYANQTYTNDTANAIFVTVEHYSNYWYGQMAAVVNGITVAQDYYGYSYWSAGWWYWGHNYRSPMQFFVPPGATYRVENARGVGTRVGRWIEFR